MKNNILVSLLTCLLLVSVVSCDYREYADADYPENTVYLPIALETVYMIDEADEENVSMVDPPGAPRRYLLDKANNKFIIPMGVVQGGITLKSFSVMVSVNNSLINEMIADGSMLPIGTLPLPSSAYTLPSSVDLNSNHQSASFDMEIELNTLTGANLGKKFAIAVKIDCSAVEVSEGLSTAVICIDTAFLEDLL